MRKNILVILTITVSISSAINVFAGFNSKYQPKAKDKVKIGILEFSGDTSKVNQKSIRSSMAEHLNSKGFSATTVSSSEVEKGKFQYYFGVEIKSSGKSGLTVIITLYGQDRKIIKQITKSKSGTDDDSLRTVGGGSDDSIRPMVLNGVEELGSRIK